MLRFGPVEPLVKLTENQREIARMILLGDWGEFPRENDVETGAEITRETASETGVETATKAGPFPTQKTPSRRSENVGRTSIKFRLFTTVEVEIEPDPFDDGYGVTARYDGNILLEASVSSEAFDRFHTVINQAAEQFDAIAAQLDDAAEQEGDEPAPAEGGAA